jgi:zinc protease
MSGQENGILQTTLRNGLRVRLKEIRTSPLISSWMWYEVGSRNEIPGLTGISHWVEHMQFKGTPTFPSGVLDKAIPRDGGSWNAFTWIDFTSYFETLPAGRIELALKLESDRMENSVFDPGEVETERTVIISERQGHENEPTFRLGEEVQAAAFRVHSYHHEVIGDMVDLQRLDREKLYGHYRKYYTPENAILAIAGDFRTSTMLKRIRKYFGDIKGRGKPEFQPRSEPDQLGERRVTVDGPGETPFIEIGYHTPPAAHEDFFPISVMDSVLSGATSLNFFGGGISNKTSRLYRKLVDGELAASVSGGLPATIDPYLYSLRATVRSDRKPEQVIEIMDEEFDRLLQEKIKPEELSKAIKQARALFAYSSESTTNQAFWLGFADIFASYEWFETYIDRIASVTADEILDVVRKYFKPSNRVVGIYHPVKQGKANG